MALAIFDLDNTLLAGDSDYLWGTFLTENHYVDVDTYQRQNEQFYQQYLAGSMDIFAFSAFQFAPLANTPIEVLHQWRETYLAKKIDPIILPAARQLIQFHHERGDTLLIITATNQFITEPIANKLAIPHLIATIPERVNDRYTGKVSGIPSYQEGKITRLNAWLATHHHDLTDSFFYSDSHNDLPLLNYVSHPVAVDPDPTLHRIAKQHNWRIISLRQGNQVVELNRNP